MIKIHKHSDIPGWGNFHSVYANLISLLPHDAKILEVGVGFGRGTWTFLDCIHEDMSLYVLDSFKNNSLTLLTHAFLTGSDVSLDSEGLEEFERQSLVLTQKEIFFQNVSQHQKYLKLKKTYPILSEYYIGFACPAFFDLVFLDGAHDYKTVSKELNYFKDSTLLTGHDYNNKSCAGVKQAVDEFMLNNPKKTMTYFSDEDVYVIHNQDFKLCKTSEPLEYTS